MAKVRWKYACRESYDLVFSGGSPHVGHDLLLDGEVVATVWYSPPYELQLTFRWSWSVYKLHYGPPTPYKTVGMRGSICYNTRDEAEKDMEKWVKFIWGRTY